MHARLITYQTDDPDGLLLGFQRVAHEMEPVDGFSHGYFLFDREAGKVISISIWESREALEASNPLADRLRARSTESTGSETVSIERYEILHTADSYGVGALDSH